MSFGKRPTLEEPPQYPDSYVRFSFTQCDTGSFCIKKLQKNELEALYKKMGRLENITWGQLNTIPRQNGISIDKKGTPAYSLCDARAPGMAPFGHFRVGGTDSNIRVFVGRDRDLAKIILIDRKGGLQHN